MTSWKLKRISQCEKCPWRVDTNPHEIPNGYDEKKHKALSCTIADPENPLEPTSNMACHETGGAHCIGWVHNQIGRGNNIGLRIKMMTCENIGKIKLLGDQHENFEDTLP